MGGGGGSGGGGGGQAITRDGGRWAVAKENRDLVLKGAQQERGRGRRLSPPKESGTPKFKFCWPVFGNLIVRSK